MLSATNNKCLFTDTASFMHFLVTVLPSVLPYYGGLSLEKSSNNAKPCTGREHADR